MNQPNFSYQILTSDGWSKFRSAMRFLDYAYIPHLVLASIVDNSVYLLTKLSCMFMYAVDDDCNFRIKSFYLRDVHHLSLGKLLYVNITYFFFCYLSSQFEFLT